MEYESREDKNENLSLEDYLDIIKSFLRDMTNNHKTHGEWKIHLTMQITNFFFRQRRTLHNAFKKQ